MKILTKNGGKCMNKKKYVIGILIVVALSISGCDRSKKTIGESTLTTTIEPTVTTISTPTPEVIETPTKEPEVIETPTQEPEVIIEPTQAPAELTYQGGPTELSDSIFDFQVSIDGVIYELPMKYSDFVATGWTYDGDETTKLPSNYYTFGEDFSNGDREIDVRLINFDINELAYKDCYVGALAFNSDYMELGDINITLSKGIQYGVSTYDDIKKAYGEPSNEYEGDSLKTMTYSLDAYQQLYFSFDMDNGNVISEIKIENFIEPEDFRLSEVDDAIPEIIFAYKAPTKLSDNLLDYSLELEGDLYQLPTPVSEFIKNGWEIVESKSPQVIAGDDIDNITLMKDNQTFSVYAKNYTGNATASENCFVQEIKAGKNIELKISTNIHTGMALKELESALKGYDTEKNETTSSVSFVVNDEKSTWYGYDFYCYEGKLTQIEVNYSPKTSEYKEMMNVK